MTRASNVLTPTLPLRIAVIIISELWKKRPEQLSNLMNNTIWRFGKLSLTSRFSNCTLWLLTTLCYWKHIHTHICTHVSTHIHKENFVLIKLSAWSKGKEPVRKWTSEDRSLWCKYLFHTKSCRTSVDYWKVRFWVRHVSSSLEYRMLW